MADFISVKVDGADELARLLRGLDKKLRTKAYRAALTAGADIVLKAAKANVPVDTGNLKKSLAKQVRVTRRAHVARIGWRQGKGAKNDGFYGHMVEYGTAHSAARPFMRPALDENEHAVVKAYGDEIQRALDRLR